MDFFPRSTKSPLNTYGVSAEGRPFWSIESQISHRFSVSGLRTGSLNNKLSLAWLGYQHLKFRGYQSPNYRCCNVPKSADQYLDRNEFLCIVTQFYLDYIRFFTCCCHVHPHFLKASVLCYFKPSTVKYRYTYIILHYLWNNGDLISFEEWVILVAIFLTLT